MQRENPAPDERGAAGQRRTLATACAVHFVHDGVGDALYLLLPTWAQALGLTYTQVGTLRMAYSTALAFLQMPAGLLAERVGERALLAGGSVLAGLAFGLLATSTSYATLGLLILLAGVGSSVQHPLASTLIATAYAAANRRAALGVYNFAGDLGKMTVAAAMGLGVALVGWRPSVVLYGLVVAAIGMLSLAGVQRSRKTAEADVASTSVPGWGFTNRSGFALLSAIHLIDSACRTGFLTFMPFLLIAKGATPASTGFALALVFVGGAAGKLICGLIAARLGILRTVVLTELATGALIGALIAAPLDWALVVLMPLGVALNGTSSVLYGSVAEFVREDRQSRSFGLFYALGSAAGATGPLLFGLLSDAAGVRAALAAIALFAILTLPVAAALRPHMSKAVSA
jgi:MFS family permease